MINYLKTIKKNCSNFLIGFFIINIYGINHSFIKAEDKALINQSKPTVDYLDRKNNTEYLLGPGDVLRIIISRQIQELNTDQMINGDGEIILPKLKSIYVSGLTLKELTELIELKFKEYVKFPDIEISIISYKNVSFSIVGEVERPGLYNIFGSALNNPLASKEVIQKLENSYSNSGVTSSKIGRGIDSAYFPTILDGIREAGGITSSSDLTNVEVIRKNSLSKGGGSIKTTLNLLSMLDTGNSSQNIRLLDGDIIRIKKSDSIFPEQLAKAVRTNINPRFIKVFVFGKVLDPGTKVVSRSSSLNDAILLAGGTKVIKGPIKFIRYKSDGTMETRTFAYNRNNKRGSYKNPLLKSGDIISVNRNIINVATEILDEVTRPFIGVYAAKEVFEKF